MSMPEGNDELHHVVQKGTLCWK